MDFHRTLSGRVANLVPIGSPVEALRMVNASTQTIGIYPESLKQTLRDDLGLHGAQRLVSLGYAADPKLAAEVREKRREVREKHGVAAEILVCDLADAADRQRCWAISTTSVWPRGGGVRHPPGLA